MYQDAHEDLRIRPTAAQAVAKAVVLLYECNMMDYQEMLNVKAALKHMARNGTLPNEPEKRLLDLRAVADKLSIGESTLKRLLADGSINLPKVRIGGAVRFRLADVERLIDGVDIEETKEEITQ